MGNPVERSSQDPGPLIDPAGGPEDEALLGIYDPDAPDEDDDWDDEDAHQHHQLGDGMNADDVIAALDLTPHPEGGYFRETHRDDASTAIYFLLRDGERSTWHRVRDRAEVFHFYGGAPLRLEVDPDGPGTGDVEVTELGTDLGAGQLPQVVVPPGAWQSARTLGEWTLVGCTVAPPFTFEAFELATE